MVRDIRDLGIIVFVAMVMLLLSVIYLPVLLIRWIWRNRLYIAVLLMLMAFIGVWFYCIGNWGFEGNGNGGF